MGDQNHESMPAGPPEEAFLFFVTGNAGAAQDRAIAFTHVMVIDGTGSEPKPEQTVVVSGDRIVALGMPPS